MCENTVKCFYTFDLVVDKRCDFFHFFLHILDQWFILNIPRFAHQKRNLTILIGCTPLNVPKHAPSLIIWKATTYSVKERFEGHYFYRLLTICPISWPGGCRLPTWSILGILGSKKLPYFAPKRMVFFQDELRHFYSIRGVFSSDRHSSKINRLIIYKFKRNKKLRCHNIYFSSFQEAELLKFFEYLAFSIGYYGDLISCVMHPIGRCPQSDG